MLLDYQAGPLAKIGRARGWLTTRACDMLERTQLPFVSCIDRTETLRYGIPAKVLDPIRPIGDFPKYTLAELVRLRAANILQHCPTFANYCSGGIDSVAATCAFFELGARPEQMILVVSSATRAEYPLFYDKYLQNWPSLRVVRPSVFWDIRYDETLVSGECGDQLFGSVVFNDRYRDCWQEGLMKPWRDHFDSGVGDWYEPLIAKAPFKLQSIYDVLWWINFATKWQHATLRITSLAPNALSAIQNLQHFYRWQSFQQWSMDEGNHREHKTGQTLQSYKLALKQYILSFTGDKDYFDNKTKIGSLPYAPEYLFLTAEGERVRFGKRSDDPGRYEQRYGDRFDHLFQRSVTCA